MLYRVLRRTIERGGYDAADMRGKLDVFFAAGRIGSDQYVELLALVNEAYGA